MRMHLFSLDDWRETQKIIHRMYNAKSRRRVCRAALNILILAWFRIYLQISCIQKPHESWNAVANGMQPNFFPHPWLSYNNSNAVKEIDIVSNLSGNMVSRWQTLSSLPSMWSIADRIYLSVMQRSTWRTRMNKKMKKTDWKKNLSRINSSIIDVEN